MRPRYSSLITPQMTGVQVLQVVDLRGAPMAGVKVDIGENKSRVSAVTREDGTFALPVDKKLQADDPVFVVVVPVGVVAVVAVWPVDVEVDGVPVEVVLVLGVLPMVEVLVLPWVVDDGVEAVVLVLGALVLDPVLLVEQADAERSESVDPELVESVESEDEDEDESQDSAQMASACRACSIASGLPSPSSSPI